MSSDDSNSGPDLQRRRLLQAGGIAFYDDSKATTPHATLAALRGFRRAVLVLGWLN